MWMQEIRGGRDSRPQVKEEDKTTVLIQHPGSNYKSKTIFINESGLYALILSSKFPQAKKFKRWVASEVLGYAKPENTLARHVDAEDKRGGIHDLRSRKRIKPHS